MAKLTTKQRRNLPSSSFAVPSKAPGPGSYPMPDKSHAIDAMARASGTPVEARVDAMAHRKYPGLKDPDGDNSGTKKARQRQTALRTLAMTRRK